MKKLITSFSLLAVVSLLAFNYIDELPIGGQLPKADVKMKDISGKEITLKDAKKANGILVMFSCNTCPYVVKNQDRTAEVCSFASKKWIGVAILNSNEGNRDGAD